jgi:hypothetical protein
LEKVNDSTSGAKWVDIDGNNSLVVVVGTGSRERGVIIESASYFAEGEGERE